MAIFTYLTKAVNNNGHYKLDVHNGIISGYVSLDVTYVGVNSWEKKGIVEFTTDSPLPDTGIPVESFELYEGKTVDGKFLYKTKEFHFGTLDDIVSSIENVADNIKKQQLENKRLQERTYRHMQPNEDLIEFALTHGCDVMDMSTGDIYHGF